MRKFVLLIFMSLYLLIFINNGFSVSEAKNMNDYQINYYGNIYEPIEPYSELEVKGSLNIISGPSKEKLRIRYDLYSPFKFGMSKSYASGYISELFSYNSQRSFDYSFRIDDSRSNYARSGITVRLGLYDTVSKSYLNYVESILYSKKEEIINIEDINGDLVYDHFLYLDDKEAKEIYNFSNYSKIVEINSYYRLDLTSLSFKYRSFKSFSFSSAYLLFYDQYHLFPYLIEENGEKKIPLKAIINNEDISFGYEPLYVDKDSLTMSSTQKSGYIRTNYLYLPKNKLSKLQGLNLKIDVHGMGASNASFLFQCSINISHLLLGPCNESLYCIVGGVKL